MAKLAFRPRVKHSVTQSRRKVLSSRPNSTALNIFSSNTLMPSRPEGPPPKKPWINIKSSQIPSKIRYKYSRLCRRGSGCYSCFYLVELYVTLKYCLASKIYVTVQVLCESMYFLHFCKAKKNLASIGEFFSKLSKRQRNPVENFKTQSGRGGILL